jgi:large subunit ribosomal protein L4
MTTGPSVQVVDQTGQVRERLDLNLAVFGAPVNSPLLHQAVVRELAGRRAGTHDTKGRSEVSGGGKKPWKWKGGGKPFGPTPRRYDQDMPRQARRAALRAALSDKVAMGSVTVVDEMRLAEPKTKALVAALEKLGVVERPTLLVVAGRSEALERASRNLPWLRVVGPGQVSVAGLLRHRRVIFDRQAILTMQEVLGG